MSQRNSRRYVKTALTATEAESAAVTFVWVVWWEEPDKSWESICLSLAECEREYDARQSDHLIKHWGKAGKHDRQSLLEWLENHLRGASSNSVDDFINPVKEILRRVLAGESGPVTIRTW